MNIPLKFFELICKTSFSLEFFGKIFDMIECMVGSKSWNCDEVKESIIRGVGCYFW